MHLKYYNISALVKNFKNFLNNFDSVFLQNKQFRRDQNRSGGGLALHINEYIPCRPLNEQLKFPDLELIVFQLHQSKRNCFFLGIYKPSCQHDIEFLNRINSILDYYLKTHENIILIGDFNLCVENTHLEARD